MALTYINAGTPPDYRSLGIYVKYGDFKRFEVLEDCTKYSHMILPDREICICASSDLPNLMSNGYDEYVDCSLMTQNSNLKEFMINYCDYQNPKNWLDKRKDVGSGIICDSGGFQIATGRVSIINPIDLVKSYNANANIGMVLDIPDYNDIDTFSDEIVHKLACIQKRNIGYMLKYKNDDVELVNIIHGGTPKQKFDYLDTVHTDKIHKLAIPSVGIPMSIIRLNFIIELLGRAKKLGHYDHFHLLGTFNKSLLLTVAKLANSKIPEVEGIRFTTDSSGALMHSSNLTYFKTMSLWEGFDQYSPSQNEVKVRQIDFSRRAFNNGFDKFNEFCTLPCQCPVCSALKYTYVFRNLKKSSTIRNGMFYYHNCIEAEKYVDMINKYAENLSWKEYVEMVKRLQDTDDNDTLLNLRFLKCVESKGLKKAQEEFKSYLTEKPKANTVGLFKAPQERADQAYIDNINSLIESYENIDFEHYDGKIVAGERSRFDVRVGKKGRV